METWIFTIIVWILTFICLSVDNLKIKTILIIIELIVLLLQIIYGHFKSR